MGVSEWLRVGPYRGIEREKWHSKALYTLEKARRETLDLPEVKPFEPYCLRHTCLTWLAGKGCDAYALARIAGHSSIVVTQRYVHPQAEAIEEALARLSGSQKLVRDGGQS